MARGDSSRPEYRANSLHSASFALSTVSAPRNQNVETDVSAAGKSSQLLVPLLRILRTCSLPVLMRGTINWDGVLPLQYMH